jgi:hypothetical protein
VQIKVIKDMVCKDIALFNEIWEQIDDKQGEASFLEIKRYLKFCEDIDMGWVNVYWGCFKI